MCNQYLEQKLESTANTDWNACPLEKLWDETALFEPKSACLATNYCSNMKHSDKRYGWPEGYDYEIKCQPEAKRPNYLKFKFRLFWRILLWWWSPIK